VLVVEKRLVLKRDPNPHAVNHRTVEISGEPAQAAVDVERR
jgi:hypothetical protein